LALGVAIGQPLSAALQLANLAAGIVVGKVGTATVSVLELVRALRGGGNSASRIVTADELAVLVAACKAERERVVMTNGCFDVLHAGHVRHLEQARSLGDRLVVAVNSDASVERLKGPARPVNDLDSRMRMLAELSCVDWVVAFDEDTPARLYRRILPAVLVKGGDYRADQVAGGKSVIRAGGGVVILPYLQGYSTTRLVRQVRQPVQRASFSTSSRA
jgi:D-beta-D-heptose 7-phosphate kinase/D-beta-D-heptose 1-phosphate adenosyltransferase